MSGFVKDLVPFDPEDLLKERDRCPYDNRKMMRVKTEDGDFGGSILHGGSGYYCPACERFYSDKKEDKKTGGSK